MVCRYHGYVYYMLADDRIIYNFKYTHRQLKDFRLKIKSGKSPSFMWEMKAT